MHLMVSHLKFKETTATMTEHPLYLRDKWGLRVQCTWPNVLGQWNGCQRQSTTATCRMWWKMPIGYTFSKRGQSDGNICFWQPDVCLAVFCLRHSTNSKSNTNKHIIQNYISLTSSWNISKCKHYKDSISNYMKICFLLKLHLGSRIRYIRYTLLM